MLAYLDTSALAKLYILEPGRDLVMEAVRDSDAIVTSMVAYAETRSALARIFREGKLGNVPYGSSISSLNRDWSSFERIDVTESISLHAGELADRHALRGFDAIHLATVLDFAELYDDLQFLAFDHRLNAAAEAESLTIYANPG